MVCQADNCDHTLDGQRKDARYCTPRCQQRDWRHRTGRSVGYHDTSLSPYWREYLARFDRALRDRTEDAWAACHELAPVGGGGQCLHDHGFARLLLLLEA